MPIYEYQREDGTIFEINQKITDDALTVCPETGQKVERLISRSAFQLKGGGWYADGYSSNSASSTDVGSEKSSTSDSSVSSADSAPPASDTKSSNDKTKSSS